jgi:hypothetical protein
MKIILIGLLKMMKIVIHQRLFQYVEDNHVKMNIIKLLIGIIQVVHYPVFVFVQINKNYHHQRDKQKVF